MEKRGVDVHGYEQKTASDEDVLKQKPTPPF